MKTVKVIATIRTRHGSHAWGEELSIDVPENIDELEEDSIIQNTVDNWKSGLKYEWDYIEHFSKPVSPES